MKVSTSACRWSFRLMSSLRNRSSQNRMNSSFIFRLRQLFFRNAGLQAHASAVLPAASNRSLVELVRMPSLNRIEHIRGYRIPHPGAAFHREEGWCFSWFCSSMTLAMMAFHGGIVFHKLHGLVDHQIFQPLFPHGLFIAGLFLLGSSTLVVAVYILPVWLTPLSPNISAPHLPQYSLVVSR